MVSSARTDIDARGTGDAHVPEVRRRGGGGATIRRQCGAIDAETDRDSPAPDAVADGDDGQSDAADGDGTDEKPAIEAAVAPASATGPWTCPHCGYVELFANNPRGLLRRYRKGSWR
jgi:hypothetical protein